MIANDNVQARIAEILRAGAERAEVTADLKPGQVKRMPKRAGSMQKRGRISNKAKARLDSKYGGKDQLDINATPRPF